MKKLDNNSEKQIEVQYKESVFHVFNIPGDIDLDALCQNASKFCNEDGFSGEIAVIPDEVIEPEKNPDCKIVQAVLLGASTQGVSLTYFFSEKAHLHIDLPWLGSIGDVKLAFAIMRQLKEQYPECAIFYNDTYDDGEFSLVDENFDAMVVMRLQNMVTLIESSTNGQHVGATGINNEFILPSYDNVSEDNIGDVAMEAMNKFISLQWDYNDISKSGKANCTSPDGDEFVLRFITNETDTFVGVCEHIGMYGPDDTVKDIKVNAFLEAMNGNPYFEMVDGIQFILRKMPDEKWAELFKTVEGIEMGKAKTEKPKTYILRWNPAISSFKMDYYKDAITKYPDGWHMDWSIYEYEEAEENDRFYMVRVGDDKAGIVFRGIFSSDPYEGDDWAGKGKKRFYVDIDCFDASTPDEAPHISIEELQKEIPDIEWGQGHSGVLLTNEQADKLDKLWDSKFGDSEDAECSTPDEEDTGNGDEQTFDADAGHGAHNQCIDDDIEYVLSNLPNTFTKQNLVGAAKDVLARNEGNEYSTSVMLIDNGGTDLTMRMILEPKEEGCEMLSAFPYALGNDPVEFVLKNIDEFSNGIEAILTCVHEASCQKFRFFDVDYAIHKNEYVIGEKYLFALSAMAYKAETIPDKDMTFEIESDVVEKMYVSAPEAAERDENGKALPMKMSMDEFVAFLQNDNRYPDDAEFWSPVLSRVRKVSLMHRDFYRMMICIMHDEEGNAINIPLIARTSYFEAKPGKGNSVRGYLWLQGKKM